MWVISITIPYDSRSLLGSIAKRNNVTLFGYPHSSTLCNNYVRVLTSGYILGEANNIKKAIGELKKDKRFIHLELHGNFIIMDLKQHVANKILFEPGLLYPKPGMTTNKGEYIFEIASWNRDLLMKVYKEYKIMNGKLNWIKKKEIRSIQTLTISPNLTEKQKKAFKLAVERGYYGYPRKTDIIRLAKEFGCSHSTFQFHLRNAEKKLMPSLL
ncbi:MAG: helix-turn-helix domain-containing protein [Candidatus Nanoarchaeia archaeon]